jgi:hypothetical protein
MLSSNFKLTLTIGNDGRLPDLQTSSSCMQFNLNISPFTADNINM